MWSDYHWYSSPVIDGVLRQPFGTPYHDHSCTMLWCVLGITRSDLDAWGPPASTQRKQRNCWTNFWRSQQMSSNQHKRIHQGAKSNVFGKYRWSPIIDSLLYCQLLGQNSGGTSTLSSAPQHWPCHHILRQSCQSHSSVSGEVVFLHKGLHLQTQAERLCFFLLKNHFMLARVAKALNTA